jgi:Cu2+-exporting ATPase
VHALILASGLELYYTLRPEAVPPVNEGVLEIRDFAWLANAQSSAETAARPTLRTAIRGIACVGCVWLIEKLLTEEPGVKAARVNAQRATVVLEWMGGADLPAAARRLAGFGYLLVPDDGTEHPAEDGLLLRLGLCGAFAMNTMLNAVPGYLGLRSEETFAGLFRLLSVGFATLSMLVGGSYFIARAWASLRHRRLHMDLPIALGLIAAYLAALIGWALGRPTLEYWDFVSLFTFLMLVGRWTQERAIEANRRRLPPSAPAVREVPVYADDQAAAPLRRAKATELRPGDIFGVAPGQVAPVCGRLLGAETELSLAWINGEAAPAHFPSGRLVPSGAQNIGRGEIRLQAEERWADSLLRKLTEAGGEGAFEPRQLARILGWYLGTVLLIAALGFLGRGALTGDWAAALQAAISVLIVSCPCAIGLAFPLATELAVGCLRRDGVYLRDHRVWERTGRIRRVVFDKTGTLTLEYPRLTEPDSLGRLTEAERAALAALVDHNLHPFGRSLREALGPMAMANPAAGTVRSIAGRGLTLRDHADVEWSLGRPAETAGSAIPEVSATDFRRAGRLVARFTFTEELRPHACAEIARLRRAGIEVFLLSGDRPKRVAALLSELGLPADHGLGNLSPTEKADWVRHHDGAHTLMLGDGANDALAFSEATLRGTPVVDLGLLEQQADFYLLGRDLAGLGRLFAVARHRRRVLTEVFVFTTTYNAAVIGLSLAGMMSPLWATVLMPASAILTLAHVTVRMRRA